MPDNNIIDPVFKDRGMGELTADLGGSITHMSSDFAQQAKITPYQSDSAYNPNIALSPTVARMRVDNMPDLFNEKRNMVDLSFARQKGPTWEGQSYNPDDYREQLNSGAYIQNFGTAYVGEDNAERLGERDSDTFGRHLTRTGQKIVSSTLGSLATLPSLVFGISQGSFESTYNNGFTKMLEDWDKTTEANNQIYLTKAEQKSFWGKGGMDFIGSTLETSAFTIGTIGSELAMTALTGGGYAPVAVGKLALRFGSKIPKILRAAEGVEEVGKAISGAMKGLNKVLGAEKVQDAVKMFNRGSDLTKNLNTARFLFTSGAFEAGVETNTYKKIAENNYWDEMERTGHQPSNDEIGKFYADLDNSALGVNLTNHVILGISNAALFGSLVGVGGTLKNIGKSWGKNALIQGIESKAFGIGTKEVTAGVFEGLKPSLIQNSTRLGFNIGKGFLTEGVWEEGHQGIAQKIATQYIESGYDKKRTSKTFDIFDSYLSSGEEQFGSSEGLKEVIMGGLIGGVFHTIGTAKNQISGNTQTLRNESFARVQTSAHDIASTLGSSAYTREDLAAKFQNLNRQLASDDYISEVIGENNPLHGDLALSQKIIAGMEQAHKVGKEDYFNDVLKNSVFQLDNEKLSKDLGLTLEEAEEYKTTISNQLEQTRKSYTANRKFADTLFSKRNTIIKELGDIPAGELSDTVAAVLTMGSVSQNTAENLHQALQRKATELGATQDEVSSLDIFHALKLAGYNESTGIVMKTYNDLIPKQQEKKEKEDSIITIDKAIADLEVRKNNLAERLDTTTDSQEAMDASDEYDNIPNERNKLESQLEEKKTEREQTLLDIIEIDKQIEDHKKNIEVIAGSVMESFYKNLGKTKEQVADVEVLSTYREKLDSLHKKIQNLHPHDAAEFEGLMNTLNNAMGINDDFQLLSQRLLNPDTMYSTARNLLSGAPKPMSEKTIEAFKNAAKRKWTNETIEEEDIAEIEEDIILEEEEDTSDFTVIEDNDTFFVTDSSGDVISTANGTPISFDTKEEAEEFKKNKDSAPEIIEEIIKQESVNTPLEENGILQLFKNDGEDSGWSVLNTKTGESELFESLEKARETLNNSFSIKEDLNSSEEELDDDEFDIKVNEDKNLDYTPERKKYKITKKDILTTIKSVSNTLFGTPLDLSTVLQAYDNVYISDAKETFDDEDYNVIGTNIHHLHFSSFFKIISDKGVLLKNQDGSTMTKEDAIKLDTERYGWEGITMNIPGSENVIYLQRKLGTSYFTIDDTLVRVEGKTISTSSDEFFEIITGNKIVEQSGGNTTYRMVFAKNNTGSNFEPLKSNFKHPMGRPSEVAAKVIKKDSKVTFHYDEKIEFNKQLGPKNTESYFKNAVIVVKHDGKVIGYLKAAGRSDEALLALRTNVILKKEGDSNSKAPTALLKMVLSGSLKVKLDDKGDIQWSKIIKGENDAQIVSYGFVECERIKPNGRPSNKYTTEDKNITKLSYTYTKNMTGNLKTGERLYYAVVMHAGKHVAIPINTVTKIKGAEATTLQKTLTKISKLTEGSITEKDFETVNVLLAEHNKKNPKSKIPLIKDLENLKSRIAEYKKQKGSLFTKTGSQKKTVWEGLKTTEKTIMVDLNNVSVFHSPKPVLDFSTFNIGNINPTNKVSKTITKQVDNSELNCSH